MTIVKFPTQENREPHDWPKPQPNSVKKDLAKPDKKINKYIEIVMVSDNETLGAHRNNIGITLDAPKILKILRQRYKKVCLSVIQTEDDLEELIEKKPDLVFSGIKYFHFNGQNNEKIKEVWFSDYLAAHNVSSIGSTTRAYRNSYDKAHAKKIVQDAGIKTSQFFITQPDELTTSAQVGSLSFPLFVKPAEGGDSIGIDEDSIVYNIEGLQSKVSDIYQFQHRCSLVEAYLSGKEYTVGVFESSANGELMAMPVEIIPEKNKNGDRILDFNAKENNTEKVIKVKNLQVHELVSDLAIKVFRALKATSHARIDIKMDEHGVPHFLEGNLMPGLSKGYFYRSCSLNKKMSYEEMLYKITGNALAQRY